MTCLCVRTILAKTKGPIIQYVTLLFGLFSLIALPWTELTSVDVLIKTPRSFIVQYVHTYQSAENASQTLTSSLQSIEAGFFLKANREACVVSAIARSMDLQTREMILFCVSSPSSFDADTILISLHFERLSSFITANKRINHKLILRSNEEE